jgi:hypothetical protein
MREREIERERERVTRIKQEAIEGEKRRRRF